MAMRLPLALQTDDDGQAVSLLRKYFGLDGGEAYSGAHFERFSGGGDRAEVADAFTAEDLVAVTMLSVNCPAKAALKILGDAADDYNSLLAEVPTRLDLVDVPAGDIEPGWPAWQLWSALKELDDVGYVTAGKLLARKRPRLVPVYDSYVLAQVGAPASFWQSLNQALAADDHALHNKLLQIRDQAGIGDDISALRVFDVITWMHGPKIEPLSAGASALRE